MAAILGIVWIGIGILISSMSFFMGFLRKVEYYMFFRLMMFVGLGMIIYGYIKMKFFEKSREQLIEEHRQKMAGRGETEAEIDIDDYRKNPQMRQQALAQKSQQSNIQNAQRMHHNQGQTHQQAHNTHHASQGKSSFCSQCGTPLLKHHKFCPICGAKV